MCAKEILEDFDKFESMEFDELLAAKYHKETMEALKGISRNLNQPKDETLIKAVQKHIWVVEDLVKKVLEMKPSAQAGPTEVKVETNQDRVVTSIEQLGKDLLDELQQYNERPLLDEFIFQRDNRGNLLTVKAIYKPAKK